MDLGMFRGLDKILYTLMAIILLAVLYGGFLLGRCH